MPAFSRLYSSIFFSTSGVVTCFSKDKASGHSLQGRGSRECRLQSPGAAGAARAVGSESRQRPRLGTLIETTRVRVK